MGPAVSFPPRCVFLAALSFISPLSPESALKLSDRMTPRAEGDTEASLDAQIVPERDSSFLQSGKAGTAFLLPSPSPFLKFSSTCLLR